MPKPKLRPKRFVLSVAASATALASGCASTHDQQQGAPSGQPMDPSMQGLTIMPQGVVAVPQGTAGHSVVTGVVPVPSGPEFGPMPMSGDAGQKFGIVGMPHIDAGGGVDAHPVGLVPPLPACDAGPSLPPNIHGIIIRPQDAGSCPDAG
jgi:hypothetical protein